MFTLKRLVAAAAAMLLLSAPALAQNEKRGTYTVVDTPPASAQQVAVGFYPISVYQLDMASNT